MFELLEMKLFWIIAIPLMIYNYLRHCVYNYWKNNNVPHEWPSILLGNISISFLFGKISIGNMIKESYDKFSRYPFYGYYVLYRPVLVINDPGLIRTILVKEFSRFSNRGWYLNKKEDPMSSNLCLQVADTWKFLRNKFSPMFTSGKFRQIYPLLIEVSNQMIETCDEILKYSDVIDIKNITSRYTTDTLCSIVYGFNCNSLKDPNNDFYNHGMRSFLFGRFQILAAIFFPEILELVNLPFFPSDVSVFFAKIFTDTLNYRRENKIVRKDFMNYFMQIIDNGKVEDDENIPITDTKSEENYERLTVADAAAQAFIFFSAGFETTSSIAAYRLLELAENLDVQEKLRNEIDEVADCEGLSYDSINTMRYLDMVLSETLRKYPVTAYITRICNEDFAIPNSNFTIPKGMRIMLTLPGLHHDPRYFPNPTKFDPSRFTKDNLAKRDAFVNLSFGEGPRYCIGKRLRILQLKLILVTMLYNYNFRVNSKTKLPIKFVTDSFLQIPRDSIYLNLEKRRR